MKEVNQQLLRNSDVQPTSDVIAEALKEADKAYTQFLNELVDHQIQLEWRYYTDGKAWLAKGLYKWLGVRGGQKVMTVFWLSIWDGFFKVTVYVPEKARGDVLDLPLEDRVKEMIVHSNPLGKLRSTPIMFELYTNEFFESLFTVIEFKKNIK